ncbi:MAG: thioredoxin domain-containing protein [Bryobacteraceae bacterium]
MARHARMAGLLVLAAALLCAQDWQSATDLPQVDLSGLSAAQQAKVLGILRDYDCSCGCGMKLAECRIKDPKCYYSRGLASVIVASIKAGQSEADARQAAADSQFAHVQSREAQLLEDAIMIPTAGAPSLGPEKAKITLVEFSDFQCPYCAVAAPVFSELLKAYPDQVKLIFKQYPLEIHNQAALAAAAALAAKEQNKFWEMHDAMFANRHNLGREQLMVMAKGIGLDMTKFQADLDSPAIKKELEQDVKDGDDARVEGTPTLFINGQRYNGPLSAAALKAILDQQLKKAPETPPVKAE